MIKQIVSGKICIKCQGCCRFIEANSIWQPALLENEAAALTKGKKTAGYIIINKKICLIPSKNQDIFYCAFFDVCPNKCKIYLKRPFDCQLYPFFINRRDKKVFLSVDLNCPFINENISLNPFGFNRARRGNSDKISNACLPDRQAKCGIKSKSFQKYADYLAKLLISKKYRAILKNNPQIIQNYPEAKDIAELDLW